jgi:hypothetical protein
MSMVLLVGGGGGFVSWRSSPLWIGDGFFGGKWAVGWWWVVAGGLWCIR